MRVAVVSDIHSNLPALEAVLEAVEGAGIERLWCLGDLVGYGADPDACTALVRERCEVSLVGNHDLAVLDQLDVSSFSTTARAAVEWTRDSAAAETFEYLRGLAPWMEHEGFGLFFTRPEGGPRRAYAHGAQAGDGALLDVDDGAWLINPGSVGQPRDGDPRAAWLELDLAEWTARFHRVDYDVDAASAAILAAGLPPSLAERLQIGR